MSDLFDDTVLGEVDRVADQFDSAWRGGARPRVSDYLKRASPKVRRALLRELVLLDGEYRAEAGERPALAPYLSEFPELRDVEGELADRWRFAEMRRAAALVHRRHLAGDEIRSAEATFAAGQMNGGPGKPTLTPQRIGKYLVLEELDGGGQAQVYRTVHPMLGETVVKIARTPRSGDPAIRDLKEEGRILVEIKHANVGRVLDVDEHEGRPFLAMEYIRGRNLKQYSEAHPLSPRLSAELIAPIARALAAVHRAGVLHLDIKPANILVDESNHPRLIDFGLARVCGAWRDERLPPGLLSGTLAFMPKEQAWSEVSRVNARSDIFSLGATLYFLLTGVAPYQGDSLEQLLAQARRGRVDMAPLGKAPASLKAICAKALAEEPAGRYADADALARDLERYIRRMKLPRRAALIATGLAVAAAAAIAVVASIELATHRTAPTGPDFQAITSPLRVEVQRGGQTYDLVNQGSVHNDEQVLASAVVANGYYGTLLLCTSDGDVVVLDKIRPDEPRRDLTIPAANSYVRGAAGTEVLLVCARKNSPVGRTEVEAALPRGGPWPQLPGGTILLLDRDLVRALSQSMDIGGANPEDGVRKNLILLNKSLEEQQTTSEAIAFPHESLSRP